MTVVAVVFTPAGPDLPGVDVLGLPQARDGLPRAREALSLATASRTAPRAAFPAAAFPACASRAAVPARPSPREPAPPPARLRADRRACPRRRPSALGVASALLAVAQAALLARCISGAFLGGADVAVLAVPLAALAAVLVARAALAWLAEIAAQRISGSVKGDLRSRLLSRAVGAGPRWSAGQASGEVVLLATRGLDALDGYYGRYLPQLGLAVDRAAGGGCLPVRGRRRRGADGPAHGAAHPRVHGADRADVGCASDAALGGAGAAGPPVHGRRGRAADPPRLRPGGRPGGDPAADHGRLPDDHDGDAPRGVPLGAGPGAAGDDLRRAGGRGDRAAAGRRRDDAWRWDCSR